MLREKCEVEGSERRTGQTDVVVEVLSDAAPIVDHLDGLEAMLGEAHL